MKAAVVVAADRPWEIRDLPQPEPGPGEVVIKIHASGLCYTDVHQACGHFGMPYPMRLGHEPVGEIVAVGDGVTDRAVGDRVGVPWNQGGEGRCEWCLRGMPELCEHAVSTAITLPGGHAEYMLARSGAAVLLPDGLSYEQAAPIFCAGFTVYGGLKIAEPQPHERVAVVGIGGLGHLGLQFSKAAGFETYAVTHSADKHALLRELGADEIFADAAALKAAGGADVILATSNASSVMETMVGALRPDGRLVVMGVDAEPLKVSAIELLSGRKRIIGSSQNRRSDLYEALDFAARGKVKVMTETFTLDRVNDAFAKVRDGAVRFRAVVLPHG